MAIFRHLDTLEVGVVCCRHVTAAMLGQAALMKPNTHTEHQPLQLFAEMKGQL